MDLWENEEPGAIWYLFFGFIYFLQVLWQLGGVIVCLYVYEYLLKNHKGKTDKVSDVGGSSRKDFVLYVLGWVVLGYAIAFIPFLSISPVALGASPSSLFKGFYFCLLNLTFWYHNNTYSHFELKPWRKNIVPVVVFMAVNFCLPGVHFIYFDTFKNLSPIVFYYLQPIIFICLTAYFVKMNTREFITASVD